MVTWRLSPVTWWDGSDLLDATFAPHLVVSCYRAFQNLQRSAWCWKNSRSWRCLYYSSYLIQGNHKSHRPLGDGIASRIDGLAKLTQILDTFGDNLNRHAPPLYKFRELFIFTLNFASYFLAYFGVFVVEALIHFSWSILYPKSVFKSFKPNLVTISKIIATNLHFFIKRNGPI